MPNSVGPHGKFVSRKFPYDQRLKSRTFGVSNNDALRVGSECEGNVCRTNEECDKAHQEASFKQHSERCRIWDFEDSGLAGSVGVTLLRVEMIRLVAYCRIDGCDDYSGVMDHIVEHPRCDDQMSSDTSTKRVIVANFRVSRITCFIILNSIIE